MKNNIFRLLIFIFTFTGWWNSGLATVKKPDYWPTNEWKTSPPESQGMDSKLLVKMMGMIWKRANDIESVLVVRNGYVVLEAYNNPWNWKDQKNIYSCSKSIMSALIGIAIDKGYIKDVHQPVLEFFPDKVIEYFYAEKKTITLAHLLTMATGLKCRDSYLYGWRDIKWMKASGDWVQFMFDLPMSEEPGTRFEYCNGASFLLSAVLQIQTGIDALSFAKQHLFAPLGISNVSWPSNPQGITVGYDDLKMRPRDMAKIGYLYLNNGLWDGKRIISSQWVKESTRSHIKASSLQGYGYQWWIVSPGVYTAIGSGGQFIMVVPKEKLVVVFTSDLHRNDTYIPLRLLSYYIVPAVKSSKPLSKNPDEVKKLKSMTSLWQTTNPEDRQKLLKKTEKPSQEMKFEEYVNNLYGFSAKYPSDFIETHNKMKPTVIFRRKDLSGLPMFYIILDDIPQGMLLENTGSYMIERYKKIPGMIKSNVEKQALIKLSNGTDANYFQLNWNTKSAAGLTTGVLAYKDNKMIGAIAVGMEDTPIEYLTNIVKSLRFDQKKVPSN